MTRPPRPPNRPENADSRRSPREEGRRHDGEARFSREMPREGRRSMEGRGRSTDVRETGRPEKRSTDVRETGRPEKRMETWAEARPAGTTLPVLKGDVLEGRNIVVEALRRQRRPLRRILLDEGAKPDEKVREILEKGGARVERVPRHVLDRLSQTGVHNGVIAEAGELPELSLREVLDANPNPFLVLVDEVQYEHNLGAILRSALGSGVDAVIIPVQRGKGVTPVVQRVSMGGAEAVPVVREGISSSLAEIQRRGILVAGADMDGVPPWEVDLTGPVALVLGGEDKGLTAPVRKRCDVILGVPLLGNLESLNVSVTAAVLMFERVRQLSKR